jgi:hypothetical protein
MSGTAVVATGGAANRRPPAADATIAAATSRAQAGRSSGIGGRRREFLYLAPGSVVGLACISGGAFEMFFLTSFMVLSFPWISWLEVSRATVAL